MQLKIYVLTNKINNILHMLAYKRSLKNLQHTTIHITAIEEAKEQFINLKCNSLFRLYHEV